MRSAVGNGLCRFVIGISCRTMLGCGPQMCSDVADLIRRSSGNGGRCLSHLCYATNWLR